MRELRVSYKKTAKRRLREGRKPRDLGTLFVPKFSPLASRKEGAGNAGCAVRTRSLRAKPHWTGRINSEVLDKSDFRHRENKVAKRIRATNVFGNHAPRIRSLGGELH